MTIAWVLGSKGLLGSALCRVLHFGQTDLFVPAERFCWGDEQEFIPQLTAAVEAFSARAEGLPRWEVYWAAGVGNMSSSEADLALETRALTRLLRLLDSAPRLAAMPGAVVLASSAGAIYAGAADHIISEDTVPAPTTAYAREKLKQEHLVRSFVRAGNDRIALLARLSTVYGPGQSLNKQQGLFAHIARCIIRNQPIQVYVPLDTIRDYIDADDAAAAMIAALRAIPGTSTAFIKIIASEQPVTVAEIISIFKRLARRAPRVVTSSGRLTNLYSRRMQFHSVATLPYPVLPRTSLLVGIAKVMAAERAAYAVSHY
ncbi:MAG TPA: NAD-dependent epimerase/dehydratase family protein [Candidatus Competibacter sp.]|nr:NAD-dependent epimerase/dehydratase family protein [Candidatus Competibacter sp.]